MDNSYPSELLQNTIYNLQRIKEDPTIGSYYCDCAKAIDDSQVVFENVQTFRNDESLYVLLDITISFLNDTIIAPFLEMINRINQENLQLKDFSEEVDHFTMKIEHIKEWFPKVFKTDQNCLFRQNKNSPEWQLVNKFIHNIDLDTPENIQKEHLRFGSLISVGCAYSLLGKVEYSTPISKLITQNLGGLYYLLQQEKAKKINLKLIRQPNLQFAEIVWQIMDNCKIAKIFLKSVYVGIKLNQNLYLPMLFSPITIDSIYEEINNNTLYDFQIFSGLGMVESNLFKSLSEPLKSKQNRSSKIKVRMLCDRKNIMRKQIDLEGAIQQVMNISKSHFKICETNTSKEGQVKNPIKNIVIHLHGGGWISMSSFSHQMYTRKWANQLGPDCLIISVDYRKTPEFPYPAALDDCWQVYLWVVYFSKFYLDVDPEKIIIAGDSAGGNMALGICLRALRSGVRQPDGLLLSYPAMSLDLEVYTPSQLYSLNCTFAPVTIFKEVLKSYMQSKGLRPDIDPYLSPGIADEKFLKALPNKLSIICGSNDTLRDESIKFINRYIKAKNLTEPNPYPLMHIYNGFTHGFLNYDFPIGIHQVSHVVKHSGDIIQEYLL